MDFSKWIMHIDDRFRAKKMERIFFPGGSGNYVFWIYHDRQVDSILGYVVSNGTIQLDTVVILLHSKAEQRGTAG